jgi:catechol 2,3-dioxygenase
MITKLHDDTRLGYVSLTVSDLSRSIEFYEAAIGLTVHGREGKEARLGAGKDDLLVLNEISGAAHPGRTTGLYHFAILTPSRLELAKVLRNFIESRTQLQGWADHLVSEAIYLPDPDGNGIEVYRDRPRDQWQREADGSLKMATDPLDYEGVLAELTENDSWEGLPADTVLGHMHVHVADIPKTEAFYQDVVGFDFLMNYGGQAAFFSAGGYHHHLGANTWNGRGAPAPAPDSVGLRYFTVELANEGERENLLGRLKTNHHPYEERSDGILVKDPADNHILFAF